MERMVADVAGVIEALSPAAPAVLIGDDWGAPIVWNTALTRPDRVRAVAGLSVPYVGGPGRSLREMWEAVFTARSRFFYQQYFQAGRVAEAELEANPRDSLRRFYYARLLAGLAAGLGGGGGSTAMVGHTRYQPPLMLASPTRLPIA